MISCGPEPVNAFFNGCYDRFNISLSMIISSLNSWLRLHETSTHLLIVKQFDSQSGDQDVERIPVIHPHACSARRYSLGRHNILFAIACPPENDIWPYL